MWMQVIIWDDVDPLEGEGLVLNERDERGLGGREVIFSCCSVGGYDTYLC
jgi:hypothetical protein